MQATTLTVLPLLPPRTEMERAFLASDATYDGLFFTAVRTTGIFCTPSCPARKPHPQNVEFFATVSDAVFAGYRPCKRCRPNEPPLAVRRGVMLTDVNPWTTASRGRNRLDWALPQTSPSVGGNYVASLGLVQRSVSVILCFAPQSNHCSREGQQ